MNKGRRNTLANYVKFMRGSMAAWNKLAIEDRQSDTLYFIFNESDDEGLLYLGNKLIAGGTTDKPVMSLDDLTDVDINELSLSNASFLVYDFDAGQWVNKNPSELKFGGATSESMGKAGLVPAPARGQENLFLRGDGTWAAATCGAALFEAVLNDGETHEAAIARVVGTTAVLNGDVAVVKDLIAGDKYQLTSYFYSESVKKWVAMDGNYDASNVYFNSDFVFTEKVGTVTIPSSGSTTVEAEGKNVQEFLAGLFAAARDPKVTSPSGSISFNGTSGPYEVGTSVQPKYTTTFNAGTYEFGPATGITATYAVSDNAGGTSTKSADTMPAITVGDDTSYNITVVMTYTDGAIPVNNVGTALPNKQLKGSTITKTTANLTGYRAAFCGIDNGTGALTSDLIRGLANKFNYNGKKEYTLTAGDDTTRFIVAVHTDNTRAGLTSAEITTSMNAQAKDDYTYTADAVEVEGANKYTAEKYDVWVYQPAQITPGETHKITLA